ncbi:MAG: hypothetical protein PVH89_01075 [Gammaproteobacteria bacterium]|jgi:hypothetical protein
MADEAASANIEMNGADLYVEENFTDRRVGSLQRLSPITGDGQPDPSRPIVYVGQTQVLTPAGALPLTFEIEAESLEDAVGKFGDHAKQALASTMERLEEMRREQASSLIVPGSGGAPGGGGGIQVP